MIQGIDVVVDDISKSKMDEVVTSESIEEDDNERHGIDEADNVLTSTREERRYANKREHQIGHRKSTREKRAPGEWWKTTYFPTMMRKKRTLQCLTNRKPSKKPCHVQMRASGSKLCMMNTTHSLPMIHGR